MSMNTSTPASAHHTSDSPRMLPVIEKRRILDFRRRPRLCVGSVPPTKRAERIKPVALAATDRAHGPFGEPGDGRGSDRGGTLIRHARPTLPFAVAALANEVSTPARFGLLVSTVGGAPLLPPSLCAALRSAIPLTAITAAAHKEQRATARATTEPRAQRRFGDCLRNLRGQLINIPRSADDWTDDRAFGADDVAPAKRSENYVLR
jgi:hypothetical protein